MFQLPNFFETIFSLFEIIDLNQLSEILKKKRSSLGLNKSQMARKIGVSSQLYGQYEASERQPKADFFIKWKNTFNETLLDRFETNVSDSMPEDNLAQNSYSSQSLHNLTESNRVLAEANKTLAEANKTLAEANHVISKNHDQLIQLTKLIVSSSNKQTVPEAPVVSDRQEELHPAFGDLELDKKYSKGKKIVRDS